MAADKQIQVHQGNDQKSQDPTAPAQTSTPGGGPRTEAGKTISSRNAITHGLFAARDFIRPGEQSLYSELTASLQADLAPDGILEQNLVSEIRRAMWRLHRCGKIEESFATPAHEIASQLDTALPDPMQQETTARLQLSVDRARSQSHRLLHKCTAELRKLQTERQYRNEYFDPGTDTSLIGICDLHLVQKNIDQQQVATYRRQKLQDNAEIDALFAAPYPPPAVSPAVPTESSFCKNAPAPFQTPRNAPCPCGSGLKHKRCCGKDAPAVLHAA